MIKYTTALRLGTAETEAILRRFTKKNVQHPTYKAFAELGNASRRSFSADICTRKRCAARSTRD
jgi:TnpA family transposase